MSASEIENDKVSKGSFMFNFNKEPDTWLTKIKKGLKTSEAVFLFIAGIITGYFLYQILPLGQIFSILKTGLEYGLGIASFVMLFHSSLELKEFPENPITQKDLSKRFCKKAAIGIAMASAAALLSLF